MDVNRTVCDGRYLLVTSRSEMRMSHWIDAPRVCRATTGDILLDLWDSLWDVWNYREDGGDLVLFLRKYPGTSPSLEVRVLEDGAFRLHSQTLTRDELLAALNRVP